VFPSFLTGNINVGLKCSKFKKSCGRPSHRWEDNIKMYLKEIGCEVLDWILLGPN
jgi:hypothetical protein